MNARQKLRVVLAGLVVGSGIISNPAGAALMYAGNRINDTMYMVNTSTMMATTLGPALVDFWFGGLGFGLNGTLYAWDTHSNQLFTVSTLTGAWTSVGGTAPGGGDTFDIDPVTGVGYMSNVLDNRLYVIDLTTGAGTQGPLLVGGDQAEPASAFGPDGTLYYINSLGTRITRADVGTGAVSIVGLTNISTGTLTNLSYNPDDDMLYAIGLSNAHLYQFSPTTGAGLDLGVIAGLPTGTTSTVQMTMSTIRVTATGAPEPATVALVGLGLGLAGLVARRRK